MDRSIDGYRYGGGKLSRPVFLFKGMVGIQRLYFDNL